MSFDQDPGEQAQISGADLAMLVDDNKSLRASIAALEAENASHVEYRKYCAEYATVQSNEALRYQKAIRDLEAERDALKVAAQAVVDRWETPLWKDVPHTAGYIYTLRDTIAAQSGNAALSKKGPQA